MRFLHGDLHITNLIVRKIGDDSWDVFVVDLDGSAVCHPLGPGPIIASLVQLYKSLPPSIQSSDFRRPFVEEYLVNIEHPALSTADPDLVLAILEHLHRIQCRSGKLWYHVRRWLIVSAEFGT